MCLDKDRRAWVISTKKLKEDTFIQVYLAIQCKEDRLWVCWVNSVYLKSQTLEFAANKVTDSWVWKSFTKVKSSVYPLVMPGMLSYSTKDVYNKFIPGGFHVKWWRLVWHVDIFPGFGFVVWLVA